MTFLLWLWNLSFKTKLVIAGMILAAVVVAYVGVLSRRARVAEAEAKKARIEQKRLEDQNEGLKILNNTNTIAAEVENEKKIANQQAVNANAAANDLNRSVSRDSNTFSGNYGDARARFCRSFPADSRCR